MDNIKNIKNSSDQNTHSSPTPTTPTTPTTSTSATSSSISKIFTFLGYTRWPVTCSFCAFMFYKTGQRFVDFLYKDSERILTHALTEAAKILVAHGVTTEIANQLAGVAEKLLLAVLPLREAVYIGFAVVGGLFKHHV